MSQFPDIPHWREMVEIPFKMRDCVTFLYLGHFVTCT